MRAIAMWQYICFYRSPSNKHTHIRILPASHSVSHPSLSFSFSLPLSLFLNPTLQPLAGSAMHPAISCSSLTSSDLYRSLVSTHTHTHTHTHSHTHTHTTQVQTTLHIQASPTAASSGDLALRRVLQVVSISIMNM